MIISKSAFCMSFAAVLIFSVSAFSQTANVPTKAPFQTDAGAIASDTKYMELYDTERSADIAPADKPHRTTEQVASWVENNVTNALNIDPSKRDEQMKAIAAEFDTYGFQEYQAYLKSNSILELLQNNHLRLNAIASSPSVLLSEGALSGGYHWLYQTPMMLTYYDQDIKGINKDQTKPQNRRILVRVQVGKVEQGGNDENHIVIEHWSVTNIQ